MEENIIVAKILEDLVPKMMTQMTGHLIPLKKYYDLAGDMFKQAEIYRNGKNTLELYVTLLTFHSLVTETIRSHQDYDLKHLHLRSDFNLKAINAEMEIKSLKEDVEYLIDEPNRIFEIIDLVKETCDFRISSHFRTLTRNHILPKINVDQSKTTTGTSLFYEKENYGKLDEDGFSNPSKMYREVCLDRGGASTHMTPPIGASSNSPNLKFIRTTSIEEDAKHNIHSQLQTSMDIARLKQALSKESHERIKAEKYSLESNTNARKLKRLYELEKRRRQKVEDVLLELTIELQNVKNKSEEIKSQKEIFETKISDLKAKLAASENHIFYLQVERDDALRKVEEHNDDELFITSSAKAPSPIIQKLGVLEFSYFELHEATLNFDDSAKIMQGMYHSVYRGVLRHTTLAIKIVNPKFWLSEQEFLQEVKVLNRLRHPNLVNLIGICSEHQSLIYEYLPNKSLGEHLNVTDGNYLNLSWQLVISIATDVCSALIFLHACGLIHGNLKPSKILFDSHFNSRLSPTIKFSKNDPDFLSSGTPSRESDIYSFGILILRLLTTTPESKIITDFNFALKNNKLSDILHESARKWPFVQVSQLVYLGLRCCNMNPCDRPDLISDAWKVLEPLRRISSPTSMFISTSIEADIAVPSHFLCPIFQEAMIDPFIAYDGFTYEGEAIREWLNGGHDTSPMTNMKLSRKELIPNLALRSAVHEWLEQHGKGH